MILNCGSELKIYFYKNILEFFKATFCFYKNFCHFAGCTLISITIIERNKTVFLVFMLKGGLELKSDIYKNILKFSRHLFAFTKNFVTMPEV